tara:strand:+ start:557 stop:742 length:186 start_codon:yes stop_codon:yes gene_type:complete
VGISLGGLNNKVLDFFKKEMEENNLTVEEMIKCLASVTVSVMVEVGAESVTTPNGTLIIEK